MIPPRKSESGFALLLVFAMASIVAIGLYYSMPRVAFEAQRDKEQTLIDRGEQYQRAIQLYVRKNKKWPGKIEDLENTNSVRYLRRRYIDPMTGKDEWRQVHVGPTGVLTDSLVKPLGKDNKKEAGVNNFITELQPLGGGNDPQGAINPALRKRPSDQAPAGGIPGDPTSPGGSTGDTTDPALVAGNGNQQRPGNFQPGPNGLPQQLQPPGNTQPPPPPPNLTGGISTLGAMGSGAPAPTYSTAPGANGNTPPPISAQNAGQVPGQNPGQTPNSAAALIQGLLTSPRSGGPPGVGGGSPVGQTMGAGIAGFASTFEGTGIKTYRDQDEYQKWEFVYDMTKDRAVTGGQNAIPQAAGPGGTPIGRTPGQPMTPGQTGFNQSSFGQSGRTTPTPVKQP